MLKISIFILLLSALLVIGLYNWIYGVRVKKVKLQIGIDLPRTPLILLKISTLFALFSFIAILLIDLFFK